MRFVPSTTTLALCIVAMPALTSAQSALDSVLRAWDDHQIVAIAEGHRIAEPMRFFEALIGHARFPEIGADVVPAELRKVWGDTTVVNGPWDAPIYAGFLRAVRDRNASLPERRCVRVLACDPPIDWTRVSTIADAAEYLARDEYCAALVEREVIARGRRALLVMGDAHVARRSITGQPTTNTVSRIEAKHPGATFVVLTDLGQFSESTAIEARLGAGPVPVLIPFSTSWLGELLAVPPRPPTRTRVGGGQATAETVAITQPPRFREVGDALLYLGPKESLTRSVPAADSWSPEELQELDRRHRILFGQPRSLLFR